MSTLAVNTIVDANSGNTAQINGMTPTAQSLQGFRNRIINGDMRIDQRNAGASVTPTNLQYCVDRFLFGLSQTSKLTAQQTTVAPSGFTNSFRITSSSSYAVISSDFFFLRQPIEGFNVADLAWGTASAATVTLSFMVYSSLTGTFGGSVRNSANNRSYPFTYTVSAANTWTTAAITIPGDTSGTWLTNNGTGIDVCFGVGVGSNFSGTAGAWAGSNFVSATGSVSVVGTSGATFYITGVQLEAGSVATPFERRPYGTELVLCQRYYEKTYNIAVAPGTSTDDGRITTGGENQASPVTTGYLIGSRLWAVRKRAAPTIVLYDSVGNVGKVSVVVFGVSGSNNNELYVSNSSETSAIMGRTGASGTRDSSNTAIFHYTASAEL